jgi:urease subunit gamma/beta
VRASSRDAGRDAAVRLSPHEQERIVVSLAAMIARERRQRGVLLNHPEAVALISSFVLEGARDGRGVSELAQAARMVLTRSGVMELVPGEVVCATGVVRLDDGPAVTLEVLNTGDRAVQVGSHFHFAEVNVALHFDQAAAWGHRLAIPAGTAVRFEPGIARRVDLVPLGRRRRVHGLRGLASGPL